MIWNGIMKSKPADLPALPQWFLVNPYRNGAYTASCLSVWLAGCPSLGCLIPPRNR